MADYSMYHALGDQVSHDPNNPHAQQPNAQQFRPSPAPGPPGYQQAGASYGTAQAQAPYGTSPQPGYQQQSPYQGGQEHGSYYGGPQSPPQQEGIGGLAQQMGGMALGGAADGSGTVRKKKRDRHAHHEIQNTGSSQAFNGMPPQGAGQIPFGSPAPAGAQAQGQFPAPANAQFTPGQTATPVEHAARGTAVTSAQGRVDPEQIPSVPTSRDGPLQHYLENVFATMDNHVAPPATIPFVAFDQGNSSPKFARLTMTHIPHSSEVLNSLAVPLGLVLQPLAPLSDGERPIPVIDFGDTGPPRCRRCRAYINPFMTFRGGGNKFICNMCTFPNDTPQEYFAPTDPTGVRVDRAQRPELMLGTVDFVVPKDYWTKPPVPLNVLFLIDVTEESVNKGFLAGFCDGIMNALYSGQSDADADDDDNENEDAETTTPSTPRLAKGAKIGIVAFDKQMHFFNLSSSLEQAQMLVMPDIEDPFVPLSSGLFVDPQESKVVIAQLLTQLPAMFNPDLHSGLKNPEPALLPALEAAASALKATGGKIVCSLAALPTWGKGRLFLRDDNSAVAGTDAEKKLLTTEHAGYIKLANDLVADGTGVDFFLAAPSGGYLDIATIGHVSSKSGGEVFYYPNFHSPRDALRLSLELKHAVTRETGFQALMKVRCSNGLQVSAYHGNFTHHTFGADLEFGVIDADKAIGVTFSYDGKLDAKLDAHFQAALLYTSAGGERRVRCVNLVASVTETGGEAMKYVDQDAITTIIAKESASKVPATSLKDVRGAITERTIDVLASYRKHFSSAHPSGQLVIPENLKEFGMYMLSLLKSRAFKGGREPSDRRVHDLRLLRSMGACETSLYLYPRIYALHNLQDTDGFANENGHLRMPASLRASFSKMEEGGAYLVDNGQILLLWLHASVSPHLLSDLFGPSHSTLRDLDPFLNTLPVLDTHLNAQVRNILQWMSSTRGSKASTIQLARQGLDGSEYEFARCLVEDRNSEAQSYVDWLVHLHRGIQMELSGQRKKEEQGETSMFMGLRGAYF